MSMGRFFKGVAKSLITTVICFALAEMALRCKYGGFPEEAIEVVPSLERALDRGLELTPPGSDLVLLPTYTAMLALQGIVSDRGLARPYWERAA